MKNRMKYILYGILLIVIVVGCILIFRKKVKTPDIDVSEKTLIIECLDKTVATVGGDGYRKCCLYKNSDGTYEIHYFRLYEYEENESHSAYMVDGKVVEDAYAIINKNGMPSWKNIKNAFPIEGAYHSVTYMLEDGSYETVSSDCVPENGTNAMGEVKAVFTEYTDKGEKIKV